MQSIVLTAASEFLDTAMTEVGRKTPGFELKPLRQGLFRLDAGAKLQKVQQNLLNAPPIFVRHMHGASRWRAESWAELSEGTRLRLLDDMPKVPDATAVAVQARALAGDFDWRPWQLKEICDAVLRAGGLVPTIKNPRWVLSVTQVGTEIYYGLAPVTDNLSAWTGGMMHFRRGDQDVSRAKFKLLEAIEVFNLHLPKGGQALDLGAAPGGWTQELLARGLRVVAVDTGNLDPRLQGAEGLTFLRENVKNLKFSAHTSFDLITCDMSWSPYFTVQLLNALSGNLGPGGQVIMTVKLMSDKPLLTIERIFKSLDKKLAVRQARHLWHNRREITVHMVKATA